MLTHIQCIWLESGSDFLCILSSRPGETSSAHMESFCCCNSWRFAFMRRLRTYALGGHFIAPHKSVDFCLIWALFGFSSGALWGPAGRVLMSRGISLLRGLCRSASVFICLCSNRQTIFYAQAAYIRAIGSPRALRRPLVVAQAAHIRACVLFYFFHPNRQISFYAQAAYIRAIGDLTVLLRILVAAQAARIRVCGLFCFLLCSNK